MRRGGASTRVVRVAMLVLVLVLVSTATSVPVAGGAGAAFTVNSTADALDTNPGNGQCRTAAGTCTLRAAIQETNALGNGPNTISLPSSIFTLTRFGRGEDLARTGDLDVTSSLIIVGSTGLETGTSTVKGASGWDDRIFDVRPGASLTLIRTVVREGRSDVGAGIFNRTGSTLSLSESSVLANHASSVGGGIQNSGSLTLTSSDVSQNDASLAGGGISNCALCSATLNGKTTVTQNAAGIKGGGIRNTGVLTLTLSKVTGNSAGTSGGGIDNSGALTVTDTTISGNTAGGGGGGGIANDQEATLTGSTISGNFTSGGGGGISTTDRLTTIDVTVSGNSAGDSGGGIFVFGGAVAGVVTANNVTITQNAADTDSIGGGDGGGVRIEPVGESSPNGGTLTIGNSILGGNLDRSPTTRHPDCSGRLASTGFNLFGNGLGCTITGTTTGNLNGANPRLEPLADYGGPTFTHALAHIDEIGIRLSPAVDRGSPAAPGSGGNACADSADQRGFSRPTDGNGDGVARCDVGAFEQPASELPVGTFALAPDDVTAAVGSHVAYTFAWTVPGPGWRTLDTLHLRILDDEGIVLWVQFKEITGSPGTFSLVNPKNGNVGRGFAPGSNKRLETEAAVVHLSESSVDGPPGSRVTLTLELSFKQQASGRSYDVEVLAVDDVGTRQGFVPAGRLTVNSTKS